MFVRLFVSGMFRVWPGVIESPLPGSAPVTVSVLLPVPIVSVVELTAMIRPEPAPWRFKYLLMVTPEVQETPDGQAGMFTVCPAVAALMAVWTSVGPHDAAVTWASALKELSPIARM